MGTTLSGLKSSAPEIATEEAPAAASPFRQWQPDRATDVPQSAWHHRLPRTRGVTAQTGKVPGKPGRLGCPMASTLAAVLRAQQSSKGISLGLRDHDSLCTQGAAQMQGPRCVLSARPRNPLLCVCAAFSGENLLGFGCGSHWPHTALQVLNKTKRNTNFSPQVYSPEFKCQQPLRGCW